MKSLFIPNDSADVDGKNLDNKMILFASTLVDDLEKLIMNIIPLNNGMRSNHQTKQAIRVFYSLVNEEFIPTNTNASTKKLRRRCLYGPKFVLSTTGLDPTDYRVYPFTPLLKELLTLVNKILKRKLGEVYKGDHNSCKVKIYN